MRPRYAIPPGSFQVFTWRRFFTAKFKLQWATLVPGQWVHVYQVWLSYPVTWPRRVTLTTKRHVDHDVSREHLVSRWPRHVTWPRCVTWPLRVTWSLRVTLTTSCHVHLLHPTFKNKRFNVVEWSYSKGYMAVPELRIPLVHPSYSAYATR